MLLESRFHFHHLTSNNSPSEAHTLKTVTEAGGALLALDNAPNGLHWSLARSSSLISGCFSHLQGTLKFKSKLHYNKKKTLCCDWSSTPPPPPPPPPPLHAWAGANESLCSIHAGCLLLGNGWGWWKAVVVSWQTLLFAEFLFMLRPDYQWKGTFFPLSGAWLCKGGGKSMDNTVTQCWPDSQCEVSVPWWTNKQRGLFHGPTASPIPRQHSSAL